MISADTTIVADMISTDFDTFLELRNADGDAIIVGDDDGGEGTNSRIVHALAPGQYALWARSREPFTFGAYMLRVAAVTEAAREN